MGHLDKCVHSTTRHLEAVVDAGLGRVRLNEPVNSMSCSNLAVIFGPTLLRPPPGADQGLQLADMSAQCKAVETILDHYKESASSPLLFRVHLE